MVRFISSLLFLVAALLIVWAVLEGQKTKSVKKLDYVPSEFIMNLNVDESLEILKYPEKYPDKFDKLIRDMHLAMLKHVANRMALGDVWENMETAYEKHHDYLRDLYYEDLKKLNDNTDDFYDDWYDSSTAEAVLILKEISSKYACFLVNHVVMSVVRARSGEVDLTSELIESPCKIVMDEALDPMMRRLKDRAVIRDFEKSKDVFANKIESVIAELATQEVQDTKQVTRKMATKIYGYTLSETDLEMSAISIVKVGFDLESYFDITINEANKEMIVSLPNPKILSHEVFPKVDKLDIGWLREINNEDFNRNINLLRKEFRKEALESEIMTNAKIKAGELMQVFVEPLLNSFQTNYTLKIYFQEPKNVNIPEETRISTKDSLN